MKKLFLRFQAFSAFLKRLAFETCGISLIEAALVLAIFSISMGGMISVFSTLTKIKRDARTIENKGVVLQAIKHYMQMTGRIPVPYRARDRSIAGPVICGFLPHKDLGIPESVCHDGHGNKFIYVVNAKYIGNADCDKTTLIVLDSAKSDVISKDGNNDYVSSNDLLFALISFNPYFNKDKKASRDDCNRLIEHNIYEILQNKDQYTLYDLQCAHMRVWWVSKNAFYIGENVHSQRKESCNDFAS
ncbi:type II secretion system protein [Candidatus Gromoviella agglomerans]|uniref:type II secretion system protein n=1 Tax=Candidatus Gromoviella agglomerans TaxID=2806609 RepID=UPI001E49EC7E|nr:type II secretion system protein [Candidatus Gromoviella agglomerans]UFX98629.1 PulG/GspG-like type II secretion system domain protein [Candidatus Gromoviella agglomerans]